MAGWYDEYERWLKKQSKGLGMNWWGEEGSVFPSYGGMYPSNRPSTKTPKTPKVKAPRSASRPVAMSGRVSNFWNPPARESMAAGGGYIAPYGGQTFPSMEDFGARWPTQPGNWEPIFGPMDASLVPSLQQGVSSLWNQARQSLLSGQAGSLLPGARGPGGGGGVSLREHPYGWTPSLESYTPGGAGGMYNVTNQSGKYKGRWNPVTNTTFYHSRGQGQNYAWMKQQAINEGRFQQFRNEMQNRWVHMPGQGGWYNRATGQTLPHKPGGQPNPNVNPPGGNIYEGPNQRGYPGTNWQNALINWRY